MGRGLTSGGQELGYVMCLVQLCAKYKLVSAAEVHTSTYTTSTVQNANSTVTSVCENTFGEMADF